MILNIKMILSLTIVGFLLFIVFLQYPSYIFQKLIFRSEFVDHVFSAVILVLCAGVSSHLCFGYSSKKARETFIGLILLTMLGFQLFHLLRAALYVPATQFSVFNKSFHRTDCLESVKGNNPIKSNKTKLN